jgi:peroxiredoxin
VLYFYPKDDTAGCTSEALQFSSEVEEFAKLGAVIVGVSKDSAASHAKFRKKHDLTVDLAADTPARSSRPMAPGSRRACTAASTWASTARPS